MASVAAIFHSTVSSFIPLLRLENFVNLTASESHYNFGEVRKTAYYIYDAVFHHDIRLLIVPGQPTVQVKSQAPCL